MRRQCQSLIKSCGAIATLGATVIIIHIAIQVAVIVLSVLVGITIGLLTTLVNGIVGGIIAFLVINKIIYYFELIDMITCNKNTNTQSNNSNPDQGI